MLNPQTIHIKIPRFIDFMLKEVNIKLLHILDWFLTLHGQGIIKENVWVKSLDC